MSNASGRSLQLSHLCITTALWLIGAVVLTAFLVYQTLLLPIVQDQDTIVEDQIAKELVESLARQLHRWQYISAEFA